MKTLRFKNDPKKWVPPKGMHEVSERKTAYDWALMCQDQDVAGIMLVIHQAMNQTRKEALEEAAKIALNFGYNVHYNPKFQPWAHDANRWL